MAGFTRANHFGGRLSSKLTRAAAKQNTSRGLRFTHCRRAFLEVDPIHHMPACCLREWGRLDSSGPFFAFPDRQDNIEHFG
jgi:hypothetical protein